MFEVTPIGNNKYQCVVNIPPNNSGGSIRYEFEAYSNSVPTGLITYVDVGSGEVNEIEYDHPEDEVVEFNFEVDIDSITPLWIGDNDEIADEDLPYNARDMSVYQKDIDPSSIYIISIEEDESLLVLEAEYTDYKSYPQSSLSDVWRIPVQAKQAAIEFDGVYKRFPGMDKMTLITKEKPYIFWVDSSSKLWGQYGDEDSTRVELAQQVSQISACLGWNSSQYPEQDCGLIIGYLKTDGSVSYRRLLQDSWSYEVDIAEAGVGNEHVHVHRLNDYRIGFAVTGCNQLFITKRHYIADTTPSEYANFNFDVLCPSIGIAQVEESYPQYPTPIIKVSVDDNRVDMYAICENYDLLVRRPINDSFTITNSDKIGISIEDNQDNIIHFKLDKQLGRPGIDMIPHLGVVTAIYDNGTYIPIPKTKWEFRIWKDKPVEPKKEVVTFNFEPSNILIQPRFVGPMDIDQLNTEQVIFNYVTSSILINPKEIINLDEKPEDEVVTFNYITSSVLIDPKFVGVEPI